MKEIWSQIHEQLVKNNVSKLIKLNEGASDEQILAVEKLVGLPLPEDFKSFYKIHNGQKGGYGLFFGLEFLSLKAIAKEWKEWSNLQDMNDDKDFMEDFASEPEGFIKLLYANPKWIPFTHDQSGNHIGLDFDPDSKGQSGQVITFGRDEEIKVVKAKSFSEFVEKYLQELSSLTWHLGKEEGWIIEDKGYRGHYHEWYTDRAVDEDYESDEFAFSGEKMTVSIFEDLPVSYIPEVVDDEIDFDHHAVEKKITLDKQQVLVSVVFNLLKSVNQSQYSKIEEIATNLKAYKNQALDYLLDQHEKQKLKKIRQFTNRCEEECGLSKAEARKMFSLLEVEFYPQYPIRAKFTFGFRRKCDFIVQIKLKANNKYSFSDYDDLE